MAAGPRDAGPADARVSSFTHPWLSGLFGDAEADAIWSPDRQLAHLLRVEAAYTRALGAAGRIDDAREVAAAIETSRIDTAALADGCAKDGLPIPSLVRQLRGDLPKASVHDGATSQDILDTALALTLAETNAVMARRLDDLSEALAALTRTHGDARLMGRTRMQAALPITAGHRIAEWSAPLARHAARLADLRPQVEALQLGGAVGDRAALGDDADRIAAYMAEALDLTDAPCWHTDRSALADWAGLCARIAGSLGKMGQDVALMAQQGLDEIALSGGGGSSAMPHKQNPVLAELLVTLARYTATLAGGVTHAMVHEQERSGAAWTLEWLLLPDLARATLRALSAASELVSRVERIGTP